MGSSPCLKVMNKGDRMKKIAKDSWAITERIIRRYPEQKKYYENLIEEIYEGSPYNDGQPRGTDCGNPTEAKVLKVMSSQKLHRIEREIKAVEEAYRRFRPEHQRIIRVRFWSNRWRNKPYMWMEEEACYSERQMKRVCSSFVIKVAEELGET